MQDKYFSLTLTTLLKMLGGHLQQLSKTSLGYFKAPNCYDLSKELLNSYEKLGCNMSVKFHFFCRHINYFPENLEAMIEEQGESFHQNIKISEGVSRLGLGLETCLKTRFLESRSRRSRLSLGFEGFRSRFRALRLETLHRLFFMKFCKKEFLKKRF